MSENRTEVVGGVDAHRDSHVAAAVDGTGRLLGAEVFPVVPTRTAIEPAEPQPG